MLRRLRFGVLAIGVLAATGQAWGQARRTQADAAVIVEGVVRDVFKSAVAGSAGGLVQLEASRSEMGPSAAAARRLPIPAPGDPVYVHLATTTGRFPSLGAKVRVFLAPRDAGGWEGTGEDWFEALGGPPVNVPTPRAEPAPEPDVIPTGAGGLSGKTILRDLGVKADPVEVDGRLILKIGEAIPGGPMQKAGFEKGDVVVGVNKSGFASLQQFADLVARGPATAEFVALNVRNNERTTVPVDVSSLIASASRKPAPPPTAPSPTAPRRSLGVAVEPVRLGLRTALKVTEVEVNGPAKKAGFEVGDVLVEAGGVRLTDEAKLGEAVAKAGDVLVVTVRDVRSGKDVPVEVTLAAPAATPPPIPTPGPAPSPPATPGAGTSSRAIGLTVKPGTADLLPVVKVAAVAPGSPAERAGLTVGDAIVGVNDRIVFAPDILEEALKAAGPSFTLTVLDVKSGKKTQVKVVAGR